MYIFQIYVFVFSFHRQSGSLKLVTVTQLSFVYTGESRLVLVHALYKFVCSALNSTLCRIQVALLDHVSARKNIASYAGKSTVLFLKRSR